MDGNGQTQIARILKEEQVLTPLSIRTSRNGKCAVLVDNPYGWNGTVSGILNGWSIADIP